MEKEKAEPEIKERIERGWKNNAYNEYVSDLISVHRLAGTSVLNSHWSSFNEARLSLVDGFGVFLTPAVLSHKELKLVASKDPTGLDHLRLDRLHVLGG